MARNNSNDRTTAGVIAAIAVSAASVTNSINYQGRLTDSAGEPLTGTYTMTFILHEAALCSDQPLPSIQHGSIVDGGLDEIA